MEKGLKEILKNFQSGQWLPADQIVRPFVRYPNSNVSPGEVWQCSPNKSKKYLSVIIPTWDAYRNGYFLKLLSQIESQDYNNFELIVVRGDPRQGRAINTGVAIANGKYLLTLDDDTSLPDPNTFGKLVDVMESHPAIAAAGGNNVIPEGAGRFLEKAMKQIPRRSWKPVETVTDSDLAEHPLLMMRAEVFKSVGGENELIPRGLDPYLRREFRRAGYRVVVVPGANYSHFPPNTLSKSIKQFYGNGKQAAFCNKFYPQWVFETPDNHVSGFVERRKFAYRIARYFVNMVKSTFKGKLIYLTVSIAYAIGFTKGYVCYRNESQS